MTAGWKPDPWGKAQYRYFDGERWTEHLSSNGDTSIDPDGAPPAAPAASAVPSAFPPPNPATMSSGPLVGGADQATRPVIPHVATTATARRKRRLLKLPVWLWVVAIVVVLAALVGSLVSDGTTTDDASDTTAVPATSTTASPDASMADSVAPATDAPATEPPKTEPPATDPPPTEPPPTAPPLPTISEGISLVGDDIEAGIYAATVPDDAFGCYWARLSGVSGDLEEILANDNADSGARVLVEVTASDIAFESSDCGTWTLYTPPAKPASAFGDGTWLVGKDIKPGRYRSTGDADSFGCYWERKSAVRGDFEEIIANDNQDGATVVDIEPGDFAFKASGCGKWKRS